eukprot:Sspe_Gene.13039::Locus_4471_Transcript_1_1_Confidence_1.000_Length_3107::g.13039::m.13039
MAIWSDDDSDRGVDDGDLSDDALEDKRLRDTLVASIVVQRRGSRSNSVREASSRTHSPAFAQSPVSDCSQERSKSTSQERNHSFSGARSPRALHRDRRFSLGLNRSPEVHPARPDISPPLRPRRKTIVPVNDRILSDAPSEGSPEHVDLEEEPKLISRRSARRGGVLPLGQLSPSGGPPMPLPRPSSHGTIPKSSPDSPARRYSLPANNPAITTPPSPTLTPPSNFLSQRIDSLNSPKRATAKSNRVVKTFVVNKGPGGVVGLKFNGNQVESVVAGGPAQKAGLEEGMRIVAIAGEGVRGSTRSIKKCFLDAPTSFEVTVEVDLPKRDAGGEGKPVGNTASTSTVQSTQGISNASTASDPLEDLLRVYYTFYAFYGTYSPADIPKVDALVDSVAAKKHTADAIMAKLLKRYKAKGTKAADWHMGNAIGVGRYTIAKFLEAYEPGDDSVFDMAQRLLDIEAEKSPVSTPTSATVSILQSLCGDHGISSADWLDVPPRAMFAQIDYYTRREKLKALLRKHGVATPAASTPSANTPSLVPETPPSPHNFALDDACVDKATDNVNPGAPVIPDTPPDDTDFGQGRDSLPVPNLVLPARRHHVAAKEMLSKVASQLDMKSPGGASLGQNSKTATTTTHTVPQTETVGNGTLQSDFVLTPTLTTLQGGEERDRLLRENAELRAVVEKQKDELQRARLEMRQLVTKQATILAEVTREAAMASPLPIDKMHSSDKAVVRLTQEVERLKSLLKGSELERKDTSLQLEKLQSQYEELRREHEKLETEMETADKQNASAKQRATTLAEQVISMKTRAAEKVNEQNELKEEVAMLQRKVQQAEEQVDEKGAEVRSLEKALQAAEGAEKVAREKLAVAQRELRNLQRELRSMKQQSQQAVETPLKEEETEEQIQQALQLQRVTDELLKLKGNYSWAVATLDRLGISPPHSWGTGSDGPPEAVLSTARLRLASFEAKADLTRIAATC